MLVVVKRVYRDSEDGFKTREVGQVIDVLDARARTLIKKGFAEELHVIKVRPKTKE